MPWIDTGKAHEASQTGSLTDLIGRQFDARKPEILADLEARVSSHTMETVHRRAEQAVEAVVAKKAQDFLKIMVATVGLVSAGILLFGFDMHKTHDESRKLLEDIRTEVTDAEKAIEQTREQATEKLIAFDQKILELQKEYQADLGALESSSKLWETSLLRSEAEIQKLLDRLGHERLRLAVSQETAEQRLAETEELNATMRDRTRLAELEKAGLEVDVANLQVSLQDLRNREADIKTLSLVEGRRQILSDWGLYAKASGIRTLEVRRFDVLGGAAGDTALFPQMPVKLSESIEFVHEGFRYTFTLSSVSARAFSRKDTALFVVQRERLQPAVETNTHKTLALQTSN